MNPRYDAGFGSRDFDGCFIRFDLENTLVFGDGVAFRNENLQYVARFDAFAECGEFDIDCHDDALKRWCCGEKVQSFNPEQRNGQNRKVMGLCGLGLVWGVSAIMRTRD